MLFTCENDVRQTRENLRNARADKLARPAVHLLVACDLHEMIPYISRTETNVKAIASRRSIAPGAYLLDFCSNRQNVNRTREFYLTNVRRRANGPVVSTFVAPTKGHKANFKAIQVLKARSMEDVLQESMMLFDFEPATV